MGTQNAVELPSPVLKAVRDYLQKEHVGKLLAISRPLTTFERQELTRSLETWATEYRTARDRVKAISARLMLP